MVDLQYYLWKGEWDKDNWEWARGEPLRKVMEKWGYLSWVLMNE